MSDVAVKDLRDRAGFGDGFNAKEAAMTTPKSPRARWWVGAGAVLLAVGVAVPALATGHVGMPDSTEDRTDEVREAVVGGEAQNVILFIGDGMADSEITAARNYEYGAAGQLHMDQLPMTGQMTTYSLQEDDPELPNYNVDSAASATAWATGEKTYNGAISVDVHGDPVPSVLELARDNGLRTGNVSTAALQDATPAVHGAHVPHRDCWGPDTMAECPDEAKENGGDGSIAEQLVQSEADLILGGGMDSMSQTVRGGDYEGMTVLEQAEDTGYEIVRDADELDAADGESPMFGVFADEHLEVEWTGPEAVEGGTEPAACSTNPDLPDTQPSLETMTNKAIETLDGADDENGFFLQVEGASIDKRNHAADPCGQIGETIAFDDAVAAGMDFAEDNPETLVVVTGDHAHSSQIVTAGAETPGKTATLVTNEGAEMTIHYGTNNEGSQSHTGTQLRLAGSGPQAANLTGLTDQTDLFHTVCRALAIE